MPLAILEFSAPGTITKFTVQYSSSTQVGPGTTSIDRLPVHLGMTWELPSSLWGSSWSPCSPWEWSGLWLYRSQCPPLVIGQSLPALLVCVMVSCTAWCWSVSLTVNVEYWLGFFCWKKLVFVQLLLWAAGQLTCASWWCCLLRWGWLVITPSSCVLHLWVWGPVHRPWGPHWAPNLGCHRFTTLFGRSGSTNLLWIK